MNFECWYLSAVESWVHIRREKSWLPRHYSTAEKILIHYKGRTSSGNTTSVGRDRQKWTTVSSSSVESLLTARSQTRARLSSLCCRRSSVVTRFAQICQQWDKWLTEWTHAYNNVFVYIHSTLQLNDRWRQTRVWTSESNIELLQKLFVSLIYQFISSSFSLQKDIKHWN